MLHAYTFKTATGMHTGLLRKLCTGTLDDFDVATSVDTQLHNVICYADSFQLTGDMKDMWLGKNRWSMLVRQYIDPNALDLFLNSIEAKMMKPRSRGVATLRTNMVAVRTNTSKVWRQWGSCMLAVTFRRNPRPQITLHSRTSYIGYIAMLDLRVAQHIGELVGERLGIAVEDMSFVWQIDMVQYHGFKSMAAVLNRPDIYDMILNYDPEDRTQPGLRITKKWLLALRRDDDNGLLYGDMKFGQTRRIRKRIHSELDKIAPEENPFIGGDHTVGSQRKAFAPLPNLPLQRLDFSPLGAVNEEVISDLVSYAEEDGLVWTGTELMDPPEEWDEYPDASPGELVGSNSDVLQKLKDLTPPDLLTVTRPTHLIPKWTM